MSRLYSQDVRDGLTATLKARQEKHDSHVRSRDPSLRTPERLARLRGHVDEAQAALDTHIAEHGPNGTGPEAPAFGVYMIFGEDREQIFVDGRPLTIEDISKHFNITQEQSPNE